MGYKYEISKPNGEKLLDYNLSETWKDCYWGDNKRPNEWRTKHAMTLRKLGKVVSIQGSGTWADYDGWRAYYCWAEGISYKPENYGLEEHVALSTIEQLLGRQLIKQFKVLKYYVDGYDEVTNTVYEIDEVHHNRLDHIIADKKRQEEIEEFLGCTFIRIKV